MKFEASVQNMAAAVSLASRFIARQGNLPTLGSILISADSNSVLLRATNLECGVEISFPAKVTEDGTVAVSGSVLAAFLSTIREKNISAATVGDLLKLSTDHTSASMKTVPSDEFPTLPRVSAEQSFTLKAGDLVKLLRSVIHCAAVSSVKPELQSVLVTGEAGKCIAAATDSFRLAEKTVPLKSRGGIPPLLLPARNTLELLRIVEPHKGDLEIYYNQNQFSVQVGGVYYTSRLIDGVFPNYQQIVPKEFTTEAVLLREDFSQALKSLAVFADKFLQIGFAVDPAKKALELSSRNPDVGEQTVALKSAVSGNEIKMSFNSKYLGDSALPVAGESLRLQMSGPGKPLVIKDAADDSYFYLAMPMNR